MWPLTDAILPCKSVRHVSITAGPPLGLWPMPSTSFFFSPGQEENNPGGSCGRIPEPQHVSRAHGQQPARRPINRGVHQPVNHQSSIIGLSTAAFAARPLRDEGSCSGDRQGLQTSLLGGGGFPPDLRLFGRREMGGVKMGWSHFRCVTPPPGLLAARAAYRDSLGFRVLATRSSMSSGLPLVPAE